MRPGPGESGRDEPRILSLAAVWDRRTTVSLGSLARVPSGEARRPRSSPGVWPIDRARRQLRPHAVAAPANSASVEHQAATMGSMAASSAAWAILATRVS